MLERGGVFSSCIAILGLAVVLLLGAPAGEARAGYASIVMDAETGRVLYSRNANTRNYPASLTKMMTLYLTFEALENKRMHPRGRLPVSKRAQGQTPSKLGLKIGQTIAVEDAILALVTKSANDAATVLAEYLGGTEVGFAQMMTAKARQLGMSRTTFRNASGLPNRGQLSTARDMATLATALMRDYPGYYHYFSTRKFSWGSRTYSNHNNLLKHYDGTDGIKTGYIRASGFNLVASVRREGHHLIGVVFGGRTAKSRDRHMMKLLDRGFARMEESRVANMPIPEPKPRILANGTLVATAGTVEQGSAVQLPEEGDAEASWGVQVGAFRSFLAARDAARDAVSAVDGMLEIDQIAVQQARVDGRLFYRARILGLDEGGAKAACVRLARGEKPCRIVTPDEAMTLARAG